MSQTKDQALFKCVTCGKEYSKSRSLRAHMETHNDTVHECDQCGRKYKRRGDLLKHKRFAHTATGRFECDVCSKLFPHKKGLGEHKRWVHTDRQFTCPVCGKKVCPRYAPDHMKTHAGQPCECDVCGKTYRNPLALAGHERRLHSEAKHRCELCGKSFGMASDLRRHMATHDEEREEYPCARCPRTFVTRVGREHHMRIEHSDTRFSCDSECGLYSATGVEYRDHLKHWHAKQHPVTCKCVSVDVMLAQKIATNLGSTAFEEADKTMKCVDGDCNFATTCARQMESHKEQCHHERYRPVLCCRICHAWLSGPQNLKRHNALKHQGERRFKRDKCGRMTYPRGADDRSSHGGDDKRRRYKCGDCGYISNNKANFIGHLPSCEQGTAAVSCRFKSPAYLDDRSSHGDRSAESPGSQESERQALEETRCGGPKETGGEAKRTPSEADNRHGGMQPVLFANVSLWTSNGVRHSNQHMYVVRSPSTAIGVQQPSTSSAASRLFSTPTDRLQQASTSTAVSSLSSTAGSH